MNFAIDMEKLRSLSDEALVHRELSLERALLDARFQLKMDKLEDTSVLGKLRREIARARTVQRERERAKGLRKDALRDRYRATFRPDAALAAAKAAGEGTGGFLKGIASRFGIGGKDQADE